MPLPSSGAISLSDVNVELGRSATAAISMDDAAVRTLFGVGGSGTSIAMSQGYGKANQFSFSFAGGTNVDLRTAAINAGWNQASAVVATNTGTIQSASTGSYALTISGSFPGGVQFINNSLIVGRGGDGGTGGSSSSATAGNPGSPGASAGPALLVQSAVTITNNGTIAGGGGGGGGGGSAFSNAVRAPNWSGGGGGGGGIGVSSGGANGTGSSFPGAAGTGGSTTSSGGGGGGGAAAGTVGGTGGSGGGYGSSGATGGNGTTGGAFRTSGGSGGAAGAAVVGNSLISWAATGNRFGGIS